MHVSSWADARVPSGQVETLFESNIHLTPVRSAPVNVAPVRLALSKTAPVRFAPEKSPFVKLALLPQIVFERFACTNVESAKELGPPP